MASDTPIRVYLDTSVLINFLAVDRTDLLGAHPLYRFVVTDHVRGEITAQNPERLARFESALQASHFDQTAITGTSELEAFASLVASGRLGVGECAAIAGAAASEVPAAVDDRAARKVAAQLFPTLTLLDTVAVMRSFIETGVIDVDTADAIKEEWATKHRFKLKMKSFGSPR